MYSYGFILSGIFVHSIFDCIPRVKICGAKFYFGQYTRAQEISLGCNFCDWNWTNCSLYGYFYFQTLRTKEDDAVRVGFVTCWFPCRTMCSGRRVSLWSYFTSLMSWMYFLLLLPLRFPSQIYNNKRNIFLPINLYLNYDKLLVNTFLWFKC